MSESARQITVVIALAAILLTAAFTRFYRLGAPDQCYFDEVYFPTTGAEILRGDNNAWEFFGHENTHPPLSKELMAAGMAIFGHQGGIIPVENHCWPDTEDAAKKTDPNWLYDPFGWRFFGALAGVGAVLFIYLIARKLFQSEVAALSAAFLLTFEGLAFAQSRIATPDTYVLFFLLGAVYFLLSDGLLISRLLLSGLFFGAAVACKWVAALTIIPIFLYFLWTLARGIRASARDERLAVPEAVMLVGLAVIAAGAVLGGLLLAFSGNVYFDVLLIVGGMGALVVFGALVPVALSSETRNSPRGRLYLKAALAIPLCFVLVPSIVYASTYIPMLLNGHDVSDAVRLNRDAYDFHSSLEATHGYQSPFWRWPIIGRPIFFFVEGNAKIYSIGNPLVFWAGFVAVLTALGAGLWRFRFKLSEADGGLSISGGFDRRQAALTFVGLSYLGFWLPWAANPRALFLYHYLPALAFLILGLSYGISWLWHRSDRKPEARVLTITVIGLIAFIAAFLYISTATTLDFVDGLASVYQRFLLVLAAAFAGAVASVFAYASREERWGRIAVAGFLAAVGVLFVYFYAHMAAVDVSPAFDNSYYWFGFSFLDWS